MFDRPPRPHTFRHCDRIFVSVPWDRASTISARLRKRGIMAVACYDPQDRRASIEIGNDVDVQSIRDVLSGSKG